MSKLPDEHGDRMKSYEAATDVRLDVHLPVYARIDGRSFSRFTRGMKRPFDDDMSAAMIDTARGLIEHTHARIAYTQSDEISLVFLAAGPESDILFGGRLLKMTSVLASLATSLFAARIGDDPYFEGYRRRLPHFDCRVCQIPSRAEAASMFVWRYKDARKNAVQCAAQAVFSPKALHGKNGSDMFAMLAERGVDFEQNPEFFKHGTFVVRRPVMREMTEAEMTHIPIEHRPSGLVQRHESVAVSFDFLSCTNREEFIFDGAEPVLAPLLQARAARGVG